MRFEDFTEEDLWRLRQEITLNSLYGADYRNSYGISTESVQMFFDSWLDFLEEKMKSEVKNYKDCDFFDWLDDYDNEDCLWEWYCCYEDFSWVRYDDEQIKK